MLEEPQTEGQEHVRPYHHGDLWQTLVQAGIAILHEEGVQALTLRSVARRAGVSHAAPYRHFADKEALIAAIAEDGYHRLIAGLAEVLTRKDGDGRHMLYEAGRRYVHFVLDNSDHVRVMFSGLLVDYEKYTNLCEATERAFAMLVEMIDHAHRDGSLPWGDTLKQSLAAWAMVHGLATLLMEGSFPPPIREQIDVDALISYCIKTIFEGMEHQDETPAISDTR